MRKLTALAATAVLMAILMASAAVAGPARGLQTRLSSIAVNNCSCGGGSGAHVAMPAPAAMPAADMHMGGGCGCGCEHKCGCGKCCRNYMMEDCCKCHCCPAIPEYPEVCAHDHMDMHRDLVSRQHAPWQQTLAWLN